MRKLTQKNLLEVVVREDAEDVKDIQGLLGILNILGVGHLMVVMGKHEVCKIPHKLQPKYSIDSAIFELSDIELIPFVNNLSPEFEYKIKLIREGIKKFMECGFYFSYSVDLTSNAQRRDRLLKTLEQDEDVSPLDSLDSSYMWNHSMYKHLRIQRISNRWMIPLIQGYVGHASMNDLDLILIARRR